MPPPDVGRRLLPSILDRLAAPDLLGQPVVAGYTEREMLTSVRADLEELLNTRRIIDGTRPKLDPETGEPTFDPVTGEPILELFPELRRSVAGYGLPDVSAYTPATSVSCDDLARVIEGVIGQYEPRLKKVRVKVVAGADRSSWSIKFHIDAVLNVDRAPEVGFATVVELLSGRATVQADAGGGR